MSGTLRDRFYCCVVFIFWLLLASSGQAQTTPSLTFDSLQNGKSFELDKLDWKYSPGDDPQFADPQFDDRAWETLHGTAITLDRIPKSGWHGIGWFRLRLQVDPALANQPLALVMVHYGASEIYLDGKPLEHFGTVGTPPEAEVEYNPNTQPFDIVLDGRSEHIIAVRHSCQALRDVTSWRSRWLNRVRSRLSLYDNRTSEYGMGFGIRLQEAKQAQIEYARYKSRFEAGFWFICGLFLILGLLHLLLYWFYPRQRANLFFGLAASAFFIAFFAISQIRTGHYGTTGVISLFVVVALFAYVSFPLLLAFFYSAYSDRLPRWFGLWIIIAVLFFFLALFNLYRFSITLIGAVITLEILRVTIQAIRKRIDGAWIIGIGFVFAGVLNVLDTLYFASGKILWFMPIVTSLSSIFPPSIFLARRFAHTSLHLEEQLTQVKQLSAAALEHEKVKAENDRRAHELEEARQLQLSMLPKKLPNLPHLDIAAYMKTASEVGGDYYDFHTSEDGTLTIAIGDATGHGLKAGTLVAAVKSLFVTLAYHPDIPHIFTRMSQTLKQMQMRGVFMALAMIKYKDRSINISIAGMPPMMLYRHASQTVERINLRGLPLGSVTSYRYREMTTELRPGDALLMLSDGLTELFNPANEMFGEERVEPSFLAAAKSSPAEIIEKLLADANNWSNGRALDDDLTLVVLKAK